MGAARLAQGKKPEQRERHRCDNENREQDLDAATLPILARGEYRVPLFGLRNIAPARRDVAAALIRADLQRGAAGRNVAAGTKNN